MVRHDPAECLASAIVGEALYRDDNIPGVSTPEATAVPVLAEVYALPGPQRKLAVSHGDVYRCSDQRTLGRREAGMKRRKRKKGKKGKKRMRERD